MRRIADPRRDRGEDRTSYAGEIHAALAYYHANRDEIDSDIAAEESAVEENVPGSVM